MRSPWCPIHHEWLVGRIRLLFAKPVDGILSNIFSQVISFAFNLVWIDQSRVAEHRWFVLGSFTRQESVKIFKAIARRPIIKRPFGRDVFLRCVMPLSPGARVVAIILQHFGNCRRRLGDSATESVEIISQSGNLSVANSRVISPSQKSGPGGRTHRGRMEPIEGNS